MQHVYNAQLTALFAVQIFLCAVLDVLIVIAGVPANILLLLILPIAYAVVVYPQRVYLIVILISSIAALLVTYLAPEAGVGADVVLEMTLLVVVCGEIVHRSTVARFRTEHELGVSEARYRTISEMTSDYVFFSRFQPDGGLRCEWMTGTFTRITGYTVEQLNTPQLWDRLFHPQDLPIIARMHTRVGNGETCVTEFRIFSTSGEVRWIREYSRPEYDASGTHVIGILGAAQDITERKQAEERLRLQNTELGALNDTVLGLVNRLDLNGLLEVIVARAARMVDTEHGFLYLVEGEPLHLEMKVGIGMHDTLRGMAIVAGEGMVGRVWQSGRPLIVPDYQAWEGRAMQVELRSMRASIAVPLVSAGEVVGVIGLAYVQPERMFGAADAALLTRFAQIASIALDNARLYDAVQRELDARTAAEAALRRERQLFIGGPVTIFKWRANERWQVEYVSPNVTQFGYSVDDLMNERLRFRDMVYPEDRQRIVREVAAFVAVGAKSFEQDYRIIRADGAVRWVYDFTTVVQDADGVLTHFYGYLLDVSERKQAEEDRQSIELQLRETQRLESLGLLAGGIAHDFNNMLAGILGNTELALLDLTPDHPAYSSIDQARRAAVRAADLTRQLLAYAGKGRFVVRSIDLNALLEDIASLIQASIAKQISLRYELHPRLPQIMADVTQIQQIVMNLIVNAAEAIGQREGVITLGTRIRSYEQPGFANEICAELTVTDTGVGMDAETQARIFEPFFSTKFTGRGLGLAAVQGIVRAHNGQIVVTSEPGRGTTFAIRLPIGTVSSLEADDDRPGRPVALTSSPYHDPPALAITPGSPDSSKRSALPLDAPQTILVVDDEAHIRLLARRILERLGYGVVLAEDGQHGLEQFRAYDDTIACVLLDLTMPRLSGEQVLRELVAIRPDVRVIIMSGYSQDELSQRFISDSIDFLQKPFSPADLERHIRYALAQSDG